MLAQWLQGMDLINSGLANRESFRKELTFALLSLEIQEGILEWCPKQMAYLEKTELKKLWACSGKDVTSSVSLGVIFEGI